MSSDTRAYMIAYAPLRSAQHALDIIAREVPGTRAGTLATEESDRIEQAIVALSASVDERPEGQDPKGLEAKPASAIGGAETPKGCPEITRLVGEVA